MDGAEVLDCDGAEVGVLEEDGAEVLEADGGRVLD